MILPLLLLLQNPANPAADRPIRIWMDAAGPVSRGRSVRLYIQAGSAGNLVVLHSRTDGKIEVLFPARPTDDPHISTGTWEVRGKGDGPIWTVNEPDGNGMILAALSPDPVWFDEFSHEVSWNPEALRPSWNGADPEGGMQDIVQRMLGDGSFTYDVIDYTVAPEAMAQGPGASQIAESFQNPDDTFPTIDNTQPDNAAAVCDGSNPDVACSLIGQQQFFGRGFRRHRFAQSAPVPQVPSPANPQGVASMVLPIHSAPAPSSSGPVGPRRRAIPDVGIRSRGPSRSTPAPTPPAVRTLASRPVTGAELGRQVGATPMARSALVLPYVHPPRPERQASPVEAASIAPASMTPPVERAPAAPTTVAAGLPVRSRGTVLLSRMVGPSAGSRASPRGVVPRSTRAAPAPRVGGAVGGWMVMPRRR